jgi:hypothetical protein
LSKDTPQIRTLQRALENCGGEAALAKALGASVEALSRWLAGAEALPAKVYLVALDLVARRPQRTS